MGGYLILYLQESMFNSRSPAGAENDILQLKIKFYENIGIGKLRTN